MLIKKAITLFLLMCTVSCSEEASTNNASEQDPIVGTWISENTTVESYQFLETNKISFDTYFYNRLIGRQLGTFSRISDTVVTLSVAECYVDDNFTDSIENLKRNAACEGSYDFTIIFSNNLDSLYITPINLPLSSEETKFMKRAK